ncbi:MAG TPA: hypothetical protein VFE51_25665 [Verrucomicrobiae bacterium]|nr:hypothetical protein [Verrucomicrobiae bacterium]
MKVTKSPRKAREETLSPRDYRTILTPEQRACPLQLSIDPGFIHHRKIEAIVQKPGMDIIDNAISKLPHDLPEWVKAMRIDHIYKDVLLDFCKAIGVKTLQEVYLKQRGHLFCSVEKFGAAPDIYQATRTKNRWISPFPIAQRVEIHYTTKLVTSATEKMRLHRGGHLHAIVAQLDHVAAATTVFEPLLIGGPWLVPGDVKPSFDIMWHGYDFFENYVEDFDEFKNCRQFETPKDSSVMKQISEQAFKISIAKILGDSTEPDWGGETSDFYSSHLHLNGRRVKAAFLFKGPSRYSPMKLTHLGKNNDQILRLAEEPADILFVQHCHDISPVVRKTLRAFAVQPGNPRRYCLIDGRDSLKLLKAYDLLNQAIEYTDRRTQKRKRN